LFLKNNIKKTRGASTIIWAAFLVIISALAATMLFSYLSQFNTLLKTGFNSVKNKLYANAGIDYAIWRDAKCGLNPLGSYTLNLDTDNNGTNETTVVVSAISTGGSGYTITSTANGKTSVATYDNGIMSYN